MKATIFKTGTKILDSSMGLGKLVINYPGGATSVASVRVHREEESEGVYKSFGVKVYNAHLIINLDDEWTNLEDAAPSSVSVDTETDADGNVIYTYTIRSGLSSSETYRLYAGAGVTRIEVLDLDNIHDAAVYGLQASPEEEALINFEQYAHLPFTEINCCYATRAYGSINALRHRTDIESLYISGSQGLTGNVESLVNSAASLTGIYVFRTRINGKLDVLLEAMKAAGVKNRTFSATIGGSSVTYAGSSRTGTLTFVFDANGDYTLSS